MSIYPPTGTLEIKNATLKIPVVDLQYTSNTAKLEANSNVVTEFSRSKKLIKYPRVALTQNALNNGYAAEASTENDGTSTGQGYRVFDGLANGERGYHSATVYTSGSTYNGTASITDADGTQHQGEWIKLQMPTTEKMKLSGFSFSPRYVSTAEYHHRTPYKGVFLGSTDGIGTNWYPIHYFDNVAGSELTTVSRTFENTTNDYYNHIALVVYEVGPNATYGDVLNFAEMELYGTPEYDPEAHGTVVTVKSYPNVPNTDWLEVYYDAKNYTNGVVQDETTNDRDGVLYGDTSLTSADGIHKFDFDGNGDYIKTTLTGFTGTTVTFSVWVFMDSVAAGRANTIMGLGNWGATGSAAWIAVGTSGFFEIGNIDIGNCASSVQASTLTKQWLHMTGIVSSGDFRLYQDGQLINSTNTTGTINYGTNPVLYLATRADPSGNPESTRYIDCKIANARLFNRALTSDEVWQLYAYQKEDFGHGDLSMTLKAGRLGIGTSEPRAALDVRGDIYGGCPVFFHATRTAGHLNSATNPVIFDNVVSNKGGGYNSSIGKFTCPIAGYYKIYCYAITDSGNHVDLRLQINNSDRAFGKAYAWANVTNHVQAHATSIVYLNHNDVVHYRLEGGSFSGSGTTSNQANANGFIVHYFSS